MADVCFWGSPLTEEEEQEAQYLGRNETFRQVISWYMAGRLPADRLNALLAESWSGAEWPAQFAADAGLDTGGIVRMFMHAGFVTDDPDRPRPSAPIRVYRGCTEWGIEEFSWTTEPETARGFAKREVLFNRDPDEYGEPVIVSAMVDPLYILGMLYESRQESEVIVNPFGIDEVRAVHLYDLDTPDIAARVAEAERRRARLATMTDAALDICKEPPMTYWIRWQCADGGKGPRLGPFHHHRDAVRRIAADMDQFAAVLEHGTGKAGEWTWDTDHQVATLYRSDWCDEIPLGHYVIEQVAPEARTDDDDTDTA